MADGEDVITPFVEYADDERDPEHYVKVCVDIPGLKTKLTGGVKNATIKLEMDERSFTLTVIVTLPKETKKYVYAVKQLPEAITPEPNKTYTKVKRKDEVILYLHKARAGKWARILANTGLETATDEEK